jgi:hypothetical protein
MHCQLATAGKWPASCCCDKCRRCCSRSASHTGTLTRPSRCSLPPPSLLTPPPLLLTRLPAPAVIATGPISRPGTAPPADPPLPAAAAAAPGPWPLLLRASCSAGASSFALSLPRPCWCIASRLALRKPAAPLVWRLCVARSATASSTSASCKHKHHR